VDFQAQVITDPSYSTSGNYSFLVRLLSFKDDRNEFFLRIPIRIITREKIELLPGQLINANARVIEIKRGELPPCSLLIKRSQRSPNRLGGPRRWVQ
jgi:hypothetical protein